ncbi:serine/threonine protein phosphatase PrpC [Actinoplanes campanulatus]|uniref:Serine/threonine protein phosphatase PrpC n=1 Tax=Actinoplanes campanulatus TaxID=113559 RepID=A0A7W5FK65_9ACTN|nr:serine/threonine protein phosphatase PrpC [Actinoplanes campanulatus]GGN49729.1 hypothetical protein GCM10010109_88140 [Actinoplanes campanulatus]GID42277.1 hypothetical protein Aca09nite_87830 [Actinoplanes campanulatus]
MRPGPVRGLGVGDDRPATTLTALPGDRYLLCSDGLSSVVSPAALRDTLAAEPGCGPAVDRLIELAYAAGASDNIACVVADLTR